MARGPVAGGQGRAVDPRDGARPPDAVIVDNAPMPAAIQSASVDPAWARFQRWRRPVEVLFWIGLLLFEAVADSVTVLIDIGRVDADFDVWEPVLWEFSSHAMVLALMPAVVAFTRRHPPSLLQWRRTLALYLPASLAWSVVHVAGMVALRKAGYAAYGSSYDFGHVALEFGYEYLKDVRSFAFIVLTIEAYRLFLRRWQGEASVPQPAEDVPPGPAARPERFLVRKLGKEFLVPVADIEWLQAQANYVNLHVRGSAYPLRSTMAAVEAQLDPGRFVRVHRSYIVNLDRIDRIEPLDSGDARILMRDGALLPCSRRYRPALKTAGGASPERVGAGVA